MMKIGAQVSAAGGVYKAFQRAKELECETTMVYTKSNRQWKAKPLSEADIENYHTAAAAHRGIVDPMVVHAAYLINVASPDDALWQKSRDALRDEVERAEQLGVELLVMHPGSHTGSGEEAGLARIAQALSEVIEATSGYGVRLCLENMAGQGSNLGHDFEHLRVLLDTVARPERLGVCLDTCHLFASGYDIREPHMYEQTIAVFDEAVGIEHVYCFHFNDSKHPLGSNRDRHEHIGEGHIGRRAFANFLNDKRWRGMPAILETPKKSKDDDGNETEMDPINLATLRELREPWDEESA